MTDDERYMLRAIELAAQAERNGEVPVGAVLVSGRTVIETCNEKERRGDATAHAEMLAIREAGRRLGSWRLSDATLYVTKEPCVMCAGAIVAARLKRLVYAVNDSKGGADGGAFDILRSPVLNHRVEIDTGIARAQAAAQLHDFFERKRRVRAPEGIEDAGP